MRKALARRRLSASLSVHECQAHREQLQAVLDAVGAKAPRLYSDYPDGRDATLIVDLPDGAGIWVLMSLAERVEATVGHAMRVTTPYAVPQDVRAEVLAQARPL